MSVPEIMLVQEGVKNRRFRNNVIYRKPCRSSITLIKSNYNVLVDTGARADETRILEKLGENEVETSDIDYVINTHWHQDHTSNNHLFPDAKIIAGDTVWLPKEDANKSPVETEVKKIKGVEVLRTPGHTPDHLSVLAQAGKRHVVAGDAFYEKDLKAGTVPRAYDNLGQFKNSARSVLDNADVIIPGHGPRINVDEVKRKELESLIRSLRKE